MTTLDASVPRPAQRPASDRDNYLTHARGFLSWAFTLDHKRIGVMYLVSTLGAFLLGGLLAMLIRTELLTPGPTVIDADTYNNVFTLHGAIMIFLFLIPVIPAALGNFVLPLMLGAKDVAFPRMNLLSYWIYATGGIMLLGVLLTGGLDTGWTFYTPYSTTTNTSVGLATLAVFILGFGNIFTGVNFITTIHKLRLPGQTWSKLPLFIWAQYATSVIQILATPVLGITVLLIFIERVMGVGIFDPNLGGDPVLYQHFFWFYSHPAVYIMVLPAMGVISELISVFSRKPIFGYKAIAGSSLAIAIVGFFVWGHHMFTSGQSNLAGTIFSILTYAVAIPSAIKVFNWVATMYKGNIRLDAPMIYALSFLWLFGIGGLTGLFLGNLGVDLHLHDTYFVVAHFHYVMVGGTLAAFLGALHYWWPKMFGRMYNEPLARICAVLVFLGFNLTFFVQFIAGTKGMPRRYFNYLPEFTVYHQISSAGAFLTGLAFFIILYYLLVSLVRGRPAPANPWGGATLEWQTTSPPHPHNFPEPPVLTGPYEFSALVFDEEVGGYVLRPERAGGAPSGAEGHR
ncbi:MAG: cytochrome c oxidase subunit I [Acidobacteria bacterium]|nr:MAG: cytochrome c oxidase subunit I [Acidobacteriota bacterium]